MRPNFKEEKLLWQRGYEFVVGLDEAGRGPLAGPVVASAVWVKNPMHKPLNSKPNNRNRKHVLDFVDLDLFGNWGFGFGILGIRDSKKLPEKKREGLYEILTNHPAIEWGVGVVSERVIDKVNILNATKLAMRKALKEVAKKSNLSINFLLIDGNFALNNIDIPQKSIIKADEKVFSCTAAGIIAKVTRDRIMRKVHKKYPQYGFDRHKGYGTKMHIKNLQDFGSCKIHRKTFFPVSTLVKREIA